MLLPVYINTYPAPENYFYIYTYLIPLRAGEAWEVFKNTFPASEKYLYTLFRRRRSAYIHLSGAGEAEEVFIYTVSVHSLFRKAMPLTETLILGLISGAVDGSQLTPLASFNVSAAFKTINHETLLKQLQI